MTREHGIDYGHRQTNINHETGIRYGVIPQNAILQAWADEATADYGPPTCPKCGYAFDADEAFGDDPISWTLDDEEYQATQSGDDSDIFILKSPYYTHAQYCSPCAPGACYLENPTDETGPRAYCFPPDWFDAFDGSNVTGMYEGAHTSCPYPVYRVEDGACVFTPAKEDDHPTQPR